MTQSDESGKSFGKLLCDWQCDHFITFPLSLFGKRVIRIVVPVESQSIDGENMCPIGDLHRIVFVVSLKHGVVEKN